MLATLLLRILASEGPLHTSLGTAFPGPPVANICSPSCMSPLRKHQGRSTGAGASWGSATEACLHGKMEWLAGVFPAWRESRGKREQEESPYPQTFIWKGESRRSSSPCQRRWEKFHSGCQCLGHTCSVRTLSAWSLEVPTTQHSKGTVLGWRREQEPWVLARALPLTPWAFLSLSLASVSHLPPSPQELCEGQYLAQRWGLFKDYWGCRDGRMRVMFLGSSFSTTLSSTPRVPRVTHTHIHTRTCVLTKTTASSIPKSTKKKTTNKWV